MNATAARSDLAKNPANHVPLSPVTFLERSATIWPNRIAVRHGALAYTYREFEMRCRRFASALARRGIGRGDTVAVMAANTPALLEAHYAVPALGAILNAQNTRTERNQFPTIGNASPHFDLGESAFRTNRKSHRMRV